MRSTILTLFTLSFATAMGAGCDSADKTPAETKAAKATADQGDKVKKETKEAVDAMRDYTFAQKSEFIAEMKTKLDALEVEIKALEERVATSAGDAKADAETKLAEVRAKWGTTKTKLDAAEAATEANWENLKADVKQANEDLEKSFDATRTWLSEKIKPTE